MSPIPSELTDMMIDAITLEPAIGTDAYSNTIFGAPVTGIKCQIVRMSRMVRDKSGRETVSTVQIILADPTRTVTVNDRLTLPGGDKPAIMAVIGANDETGPYWLEIRA